MSIAKKEVCALLMATNSLVKNTFPYATHNTRSIACIFIYFILPAVGKSTSNE